MGLLMSIRSWLNWKLKERREMFFVILAVYFVGLYRYFLELP